jgi:hypothetical protein
MRSGLSPAEASSCPAVSRPTPNSSSKAGATCRTRGEFGVQLGDLGVQGLAAAGQATHRPAAGSLGFGDLLAAAELADVGGLDVAPRHSVDLVPVMSRWSLPVGGAERSTPYSFASAACGSPQPQVHQRLPYTPEPQKLLSFRM